MQSLVSMIATPRGMVPHSDNDRPRAPLGGIADPLLAPGGQVGFQKQLAGALFAATPAWLTVGSLAGQAPSQYVDGSRPVPDRATTQVLGFDFEGSGSENVDPLIAVVLPELSVWHEQFVGFRQAPLADGVLDASADGPVVDQRALPPIATVGGVPLVASQASPQSSESTALVRPLQTLVRLTTEAVGYGNAPSAGAVPGPSALPVGSVPTPTSPGLAAAGTSRVRAHADALPRVGDESGSGPSLGQPRVEGSAFDSTPFPSIVGQPSGRPNASVVASAKAAPGTGAIVNQENSDAPSSRQPGTAPPGSEHIQPAPPGEDVVVAKQQPAVNGPAGPLVTEPRARPEQPGEPQQPDQSSSRERLGDSPWPAIVGQKPASAAASLLPSNVVVPIAGASSQPPAAVAATPKRGSVSHLAAKAAVEHATDRLESSPPSSDTAPLATVRETTARPTSPGSNPDEAGPLKNDREVSYARHGELPDRVQFVQRVAQALRTSGTLGEQVRLRLHPPELGSLRVDVALRNGVLTARLEAHTEAARSLLLENLPTLRENLAQHGVQIERFDVDVAGHPGGGHARDGFGHTPRGPASSAAPTSDTSSTAGSEEVHHAPETRRSTTTVGGLDVMA